MRPYGYQFQLLPCSTPQESLKQHFSHLFSSSFFALKSFWSPGPHTAAAVGCAAVCWYLWRRSKKLSCTHWNLHMVPLSQSTQFWPRRSYQHVQTAAYSSGKKPSTAQRSRLRLWTALEHLLLDLCDFWQWLFPSPLSPGCKGISQATLSCRWEGHKEAGWATWVF